MPDRISVSIRSYTDTNSSFVEKLKKHATTPELNDLRKTWEIFITNEEKLGKMYRYFKNRAPVHKDASLHCECHM